MLLGILKSGCLLSRALLRVPVAKRMSFEYDSGTRTLSLALDAAPAARVEIDAVES